MGAIKINFVILGKKWVLRVLKKKKYKKSNGADSVAITDGNKRRIDIGPAGQDLETIIHELVHSYLFEFCVKSTDLDSDNIEEVMAEMMAKRGRELLDLADTLHAEVKKATAPKVLV